MAANRRTRNLAEDFRDGHFDSPLRDCNAGQVKKIAQSLYNNTRLNRELDIKMLERGALLASNAAHLNSSEPPQSATADNALDSRADPIEDWEQEALDREDCGSLKSLTKDLIIILATCATGAVVQGWSQQSIVGANLNWPIEYGLQDNALHWIGNGLTYFSLVNAIPYFAASLCGVWIIDPISAYYGRRGALLFAAICSFSAPIGASYSTNWYQLFGCRFVQGIGMGAKASVVPVLESEACPPVLRGRLLVLWQTFVAIGIFLGAAANCIFDGEWRHQIGIAFVPAVPLMCLCYVIPESPRWLIKKEKHQEAYQVLARLRETRLQAARDLVQIHAHLRVEEALFSEQDISLKRVFSLVTRTPAKERTPLDFFRRFLELFTIRRNRRAVVSSCVVMSAQQFCGINIFAFLATTIFSNVAAKGSSNNKYTGDSTNLLINFGFAAANAVFSASAFLLVDRWGRRSLLLTSLVAMFPLLLLTGHYLDHFNMKVSIALVVIYAIAYSPGAGVIPFMHSSEVFGQTHREIGMSLAVAVNLAFAGALAMAVPLYAAAPKESQNMRLLGIFGALDGLAVILVWLFMRTPGQVASLEDMNYLFGARTLDYIQYQTRHVLKTVFKNCLPGNKSQQIRTFSDWQFSRRDKRNREELSVIS